MAPDERRCAETTSDGRPCQAPSNLVDPSTGLCPSHAPDAAARLSEIGRRGAEATRRRHAGGGLDPDDLPPLVDHEAAETWCDVVGRAAVTGRIGHQEAKAALRAVREWRESRGEGAVADRLQALDAALSEWRKTGDPAPVLELVR